MIDEVAVVFTPIKTRLNINVSYYILNIEPSLSIHLTYNRNVTCGGKIVADTRVTYHFVTIM